MYGASESSPFLTVLPPYPYKHLQKPLTLDQIDANLLTNRLDLHMVERSSNPMCLQLRNASHLKQCTATKGYSGQRDTMTLSTLWAWWACFPNSRPVSSSVPVAHQIRLCKQRCSFDCIKNSKDLIDSSLYIIYNWLCKRSIGMRVSREQFFFGRSMKKYQFSRPVSWIGCCLRAVLPAAWDK